MNGSDNSREVIWQKWPSLAMGEGNDRGWGLHYTGLNRATSQRSHTGMGLSQWKHRDMVAVTVCSSGEEGILYVICLPDMSGFYGMVSCISSIVVSIMWIFNLDISWMDNHVFQPEWFRYSWTLHYFSSYIIISDTLQQNLYCIKIWCTSLIWCESDISLSSVDVYYI